MRISKTPTYCHLTRSLPAFLLFLCALGTRPRQSYGLTNPVITGRSLQQHKALSALHSSRDPIRSTDQAKIGRLHDGQMAEDIDAVNLRYRNQIDELRRRLQSLERQVVGGSGSVDRSKQPELESRNELDKLKSQLGSFQKQFVQRVDKIPTGDPFTRDNMQTTEKIGQSFDPSQYQADPITFDSQSTEDAINLGNMVKMEEFRAKLRVAQHQLSGAKPVSPVDVFLQSLNGNSQPTIETSSSSVTRGTEIPSPPNTLRPNSLPTEVEELQRMVMAYHRFTKHTLENVEKEKEMAVRDAEERMKRKYLPIIAELEKANVELKGNEKQKFRLF